MRRVGPEDYQLLHDKLEALSRSGALHSKMADVDTAFRYIVDQASPAGRAWIAGGFLILFDIGREWCSKGDVLIELLVMRMYASPLTVDAVIPLLDGFANDHRCSHVVVGDTQSGYMTERYRHHGYTVMGTQLGKKVPRWDS